MSRKCGLIDIDGLSLPPSAMRKGKEVKPLKYSFIDIFIKSISEKRIDNKKNVDTSNIDDKEIEAVYNALIDKLVHNIFFETVGDEVLITAFMKLSRLEKIIVVFNIMLDYDASDVADIMNTTSQSVHTQKYKALRKLRKALGIIE